MFTEPHFTPEGLGEFSKVMQTRDVVEGLHNCLEFSQPSSCLDEAIINTEKVLYCLNKIYSNRKKMSVFSLCINKTHLSPGINLGLHVFRLLSSTQ